ncbi:hypothetical protein BDF14DRAFT_1784743 [Spinellus fusiger]|nr:hypothetical protein BDF14DRAFT_1784743 [Spinellus fusiger]
MIHLAMPCGTAIHWQDLIGEFIVSSSVRLSILYFSMQLFNTLQAIGLTIVAVALTSADALKEPPKDLQIGIKKRVPDEECLLRSHDGDSLSMHYTGSLFDTGKTFDSSVGRDPLEFTLGTGRVIKGWDLGLKNMCIGEKRRLVIPPHLGYGANGAGNSIPGGATLVFDVELVNIHRSAGGSDYASLGMESKTGLDLKSPLVILSGAGAFALLAIFYFSRSSGKAVKKPVEGSSSKK